MLPAEPPQKFITYARSDHTHESKQVIIVKSHRFANSSRSSTYTGIYTTSFIHGSAESVAGSFFQA